MDMSTKKELVHKIANGFSDADVLAAYDQLKSITIWSYHYDSKLSKLSSAYDVSMMPKIWQDVALNIIENRNFTIVLIDKMLNHDPISLSMYEMMYKKDNSGFILTDGEVFADRGVLLEEYIAKGGNYNAMSEMNAERWLMTSIGESYLDIYNVDDN